MGVEIGFVQSVTNNQTEGIYQGVAPAPRFVRRVVAPLPVKDGDRVDIWYKPESIMKYTPQQMTTLSRFGPMQGLAYRIKATDEVKSTFPLNFPRPPAMAISGFHLTRGFITCVVVRVQPPAGASQLFFLDQVTWQCNYVGAHLAGAWIPAPGLTVLQRWGCPERPPALHGTAQHPAGRPGRE